MTKTLLPLLAATLAGGLALTGCETMDERQRTTAQGAGIGAAAGAVLGAATGDRSSAATGAVLGAAIGAVGGNLWSKRMEDKRRAMEQATRGTGAEVTRTADNQLKVNVPSDISFDTGRADIRPELRSVLDAFAAGLQNDPATRVRIVGHTDSTGSDAINDPLSLARARAVGTYLADRGIDAARIETVGRGEHEPVADNATEAGRAKNRRVEILLREPEVRG